MEKMLGQKMRPPISLQQFLCDYKRDLNTITIPKKSVEIQKAMKLLGDKVRFQTAAENCSLDRLVQADDARVTKFIPGLSEINRPMASQIPQEALKLHTFKEMNKSKQEGGRERGRNPFKRTPDIFKFVTQPPKTEGDKGCASYNDLLITVRVYRPARATHVGQSLEKPVFAEEFECLGSNYLSELRDKITCVCNKKRFFDVSEDPTKELPGKETDPAYFFITDTFYNDKRNPDNPDYSEIIRSWAKHAPGLDSVDFKVAQMECTRFLDLTVSLGFPQLYQHHGNCEHVFTIAQVAVISPSTACLAQSQYPLLRSFGLYNNRLCNMCGTLHYAFIVEQSDRQLHDPAYLCARCFHSYHYVDGKKIGEFKAYRISDVQPNNAGDTDENAEDGAAMDTSSISQKSETSAREELEEEQEEFLAIEIKQEDGDGQK